MPIRLDVMCARRHAAVLVAVVLLAAHVTAQGRLSDWLGRIPGARLSEADAAQGIREALTQGVGRAVKTLHRPDGFFGNELYKVLLPPDARKAEAALRRIGLGGQVDRSILAINRGAEDAVGPAGPIFTDAIRTMTLRDALGIVRGGGDAATQYFRQKTSDALIEAFTPPVKTSLDRTHATRYYADMARSYNRFPLASGKIDPDLTAYVVGKAVDALFDQIAREEADIRTNPLARTSDLLKKVFGTP